jgi:hypothetical protein
VLGHPRRSLGPGPLLLLRPAAARFGGWSGGREVREHAGAEIFDYEYQAGIAPGAGTILDIHEPHSNIHTV